MGRKTKVEWGKVDWSKQDVELAAIHGCSRERVRQMRPEGVVADGYRQRTGVTAEQRIARMETEGRTVEEVARAAGCGKAYARVAMKRAGKGYRHLPKGRARYDWALLPANWRELTDKAMAGMVGASSPAVVTQWRVRHGMRKRGVS
jgi:hypothetical protein